MKHAKQGSSVLCLLSRPSFGALAVLAHSYYYLLRLLLVEGCGETMGVGAIRNLTWLVAEHNFSEGGLARLVRSRFKKGCVLLYRVRTIN
jgi:hypothetical protein